MQRMILKNKPLVEAIFELQWELVTTDVGAQIDPHIRLLIGRVYDRLETKYPFHQQLSTAMVPDELVGHRVQHRFRNGENDWPLVQLGPGIISLNDTEGYVWEDFYERIGELTAVLFETYPSRDDLKINSAKLRYIDAIDFDFADNNPLDFLDDKMKLKVSLLPSLFESTGVEELPLDFDLRFWFPSNRPTGRVNLRFFRGRRKGVESLMWETTLISTDTNAPKSEKEIRDWVQAAHELTDDWFFKIIEGDLLERFEPCQP